MSQLLNHTPIHVWIILAFLVSRGVAAMRDRDVETRKLFVLPLVMLALSLQDIGGKFGLGGPALAAWMLGCAAAAPLAWTRAAHRIAAGAALGQVRVRGSWAPLALMMAVFCTRFAASAALAVQPQLRQDTLFVAAVCAAFGVLNGCFLGRLARDGKACLDLADGRAVAGAM